LSANNNQTEVTWKKDARKGSRKPTTFKSLTEQEVILIWRQTELIV